MHVHRVTPRANRVSVIFNSFLVNDMVRSAAILRSYTRIQRTVTEIELSPRRLSPRWERTLRKPSAFTEFQCHFPRNRKYEEKISILWKQWIKRTDLSERIYLIIPVISVHKTSNENENINKISVFKILNSITKEFVSVVATRVSLDRSRYSCVALAYEVVRDDRGAPRTNRTFTRRGKERCRR